MAQAVPGLLIGRYCPGPLCIVYLVPCTVRCHWSSVSSGLCPFLFRQRLVFMYLSSDTRGSYKSYGVDTIRYHQWDLLPRCHQAPNTPSLPFLLEAKLAASGQVRAFHRVKLMCVKSLGAWARPRLTYSPFVAGP